MQEGGGTSQVVSHCQVERMNARWDTYSWAFEGERAEASFEGICEDLESQNRYRHTRLAHTHNSLEGFFPFFLTSLWLFNRCAFPALGSHGIAQLEGGRGKISFSVRFATISYDSGRLA